MQYRFFRILFAIAVCLLPLASALAAPVETVLHHFENSPIGYDPQSGVIADDNGRLFGTTYSGGASLLGTVYQLVPPSGGNKLWTHKVIHNFQGGIDGSNPQTSLIADASGALYGTTPNGGLYNNGVIFRLSPPVAGQSAWTETVLYSFQNNIARGNYNSSLTMDKYGALYGATTNGGRYYSGSIFKLSPPAVGKTVWTETTLYSFKCSDGGCAPYTSLLFDARGALYGTTSAGNGTVFKLTPPASGTSSWTKKTLTRINIYGGGFVEGNLVADSSGTLYGCTVSSAYGNGQIYKLTPPQAGQTQWTRTTLISFVNGTADAEELPPALPLAIDANGNLYSVTNIHGAFNAGTVFMLKRPVNGESGWTHVELHSFSKDGDGFYPSGGLIMDRTGSLYGTTERGGQNGVNDGTIYKLTPPLSGQTAWVESLLYSFPGNDGGKPASGLLKGSNGVLYGTTVEGGAFDYGAVIELTPPDTVSGSWKAMTLYSFTGEGDGSGPRGALIADSAGALYGTTYEGGELGYGTVFKLSPPTAAGGGWTETVLHSFNNDGVDGAGPVATLLAGPGGVLYGMTAWGGIGGAISPFDSGYGTIFQLSPPAAGQIAWTETILYRFTNGEDGAVPFGGLVAGENGVLYGTASQGTGSTLGKVFELIPPWANESTWQEATLFTFPGQVTGQGFPTGTLLIDQSGALYGTTQQGQNDEFKLGGTVFKLTPPKLAQGQWQESTLYMFGSKAGDGNTPTSSLVVDAAGALYGTTKKGGLYNRGTVFKLAPPAAGETAWVETILDKFERHEDGTNPVSSLILGANSTVYGTTASGGRAGAGTVFQITQ